MGTEKRYSARWHYAPKDKRDNERGKTKTGSRKLRHLRREQEIKGGRHDLHDQER